MSTSNSKAKPNKKVEEGQVPSNTDNGEMNAISLESSTPANPKSRSNATPATASPNCSITTLSNELLYKIIEQLHPVEPVCLGLTCKVFYALHRTKNPKVSLDEHVSEPHPFDDDSWAQTCYTPEGTTLTNYLRSWVPPNLTYNYNYKSKKFVTREKFQVLVEGWRVEKRKKYLSEMGFLFRGGLPQEVFEKWADRYMKEIEKQGWEWESLEDDAPLTNNQRRLLIAVYTKRKA